MNKDPYQILGLNKDASQDEIKKAFRKKAIQHHPDKGGDEEKFKEINWANSILSDSQKKEQYDNLGHVGKGQEFEGFNMNDIFSHFENMFGFRRNRQGYNNQNKGTNLRIKIKVNLKEVLEGTQRKIKINRHVKCDSCSGRGGTGEITCLNCKGSGQLTNSQRTAFGMFQQTIICYICNGSGKIIQNKCHNCSGEGIIPKQEYLGIEIPKGVEEGMQLNMPGYGNCGKNNGPNGDLLILIEEEKHPHLIREGLNVIYNLDLNYVDACLGSNIEIPTILNNTKIDIKSGTQPGKVLKLKRKGLPNINNSYEVGDQLININVIIPNNLKSEEKHLLEQIKELK